MALGGFRKKKLYIPVLVILQLAVIYLIYSANEAIQDYIYSDSFARILFNIPPRKHAMCKTKSGELEAINLWDGMNDSNKSFNNADDDRADDRQLCPEYGKLRGESLVDVESEPNCLQVIMKDNPHVQNGGSFSPECKARNKAAIIIPFRNREQHLLYFLQYMHPLLQRQQLQYKIFVINQDGMQIFNKDKLMNIGFVEALKEDFHCFIFHDVDLILTNDRCMYQCSSQPIHFARNIDKYGGLIYKSYFGGAIGLSEKQFRKINGFPNTFLGWGGEDDVILTRVRAVGMSFFRYQRTVAKYKMVKHTRDLGNPRNGDRNILVSYAGKTYTKDGLNTLPETYKIVDRFEHPLFTMITVEFDYNLERRLLEEIKQVAANS